MKSSSFPSLRVEPELREAAEMSAKVDLALRAVVVAESIECTDEELDEASRERGDR